MPQLTLKEICFVLLMGGMWPEISLSEDNRAFEVTPSRWLTQTGEFHFGILHPTQPYPEVPPRFTYEERIAENEEIPMRARVFPGDGTHALIAYGMGRVRRVDMAQHRTTWEYSGTVSSPVIEISEDGKIVTLVQGDGRLIILSGDNGNLINATAAEDGLWQTAVAISQDGSMVITGTNQGEVRVYRTATLQLIWSNKGFAFPLTHVRIGQTGNMTYVAASDGATIKLWNLDEDRLLSTYGQDVSEVGLPEFWISSLDFGPQKRHLIVGGYREVMLLDTRDGTIARRFVGSEVGLLAANISNDLTTAIGYTRDHLVMRWDLDDPAVQSGKWVRSGQLTTFCDLSLTQDNRMFMVLALEPRLGIPLRLYTTLRLYSVEQ